MNKPKIISQKEKLENKEKEAISKDLSFIDTAIEYLKVKKRWIIVAITTVATFGISYIFGFSSFAEKNVEKALENKITDSINRFYAGDSEIKTINNFNVRGVNLNKEESSIAFYGIATLEGVNSTKYAMAEYSLNNSSLKQIERLLGAKNTQATLNAFINIVAGEIIKNTAINYGCDVNILENLALKIQNEDKYRYEINKKVLQLSDQEFANLDGTFKILASIYYVGAPVYDSVNNKVSFEVRSNVIEQKKIETFNGKYAWQNYLICTKSDTVSMDMIVCEELIQNPNIVYDYMTRSLKSGAFSVVEVTNNSVIETYNINQKIEEQVK
ncbi:MAG: hypothetical protein WCX32_03400 [Clostridia bacterium]|jgi:hypothetical protein|nr:hypothetical protein [Clostridia bacterium]MDD4275535.1 hypothetical protein [Clostridia bacterium]